MHRLKFLIDSQEILQECATKHKNAHNVGDQEPQVRKYVCQDNLS